MDLSIIIVSYNTKKLLKDCLKSAFESIEKKQSSSKFQFEVFVVDNGSKDGSVEMVEKDFPQVKLIENKENLGFAKANNQAIKKAQGRYILLLNSDTIVLGNTLSKMINWMDSHPEVGISSCQLLNPDRSIQATGGYFPTLPRVLAWMFFLDDLPFLGKAIKPFHPHTPQFYTKDKTYTKEQELDWVTGAFFLVRREVFKKIGVLDEKFFMYVEEMEFCFRAKESGFKVVFVPESSIIHLGQRSSRVGSEGAVLGEYRGLLYFYKKHKPGWEIFPLRALLKIGAILRMVIFGLLKGRKAGAVYAKAFALA